MASGNDRVNVILIIGVLLGGLMIGCRRNREDATTPDPTTATSSSPQVEGEASAKHGVAQKEMDGGYKLLLQSGRAALALEHLQKALRLFAEMPNCEMQEASCRSLISHAFKDLGMDEKAIEEMKKSLAIFVEIPGTEETQARIRTMLGMCLCELEQFNEGVGELKKAKALFASLPEAEQEETDCSELISRYESCMDPGGDKPITPLTEAQIQARLEARKQFERAVRSKDHVDSIIAFRAALTQWEKVPGSARKKAYCHGLLASELIKLGRNQEGAEEAKKALQLYSKLRGAEVEQADCRRMIGPILLGQGRKGSESIPDFSALGTEGTLLMAESIQEGHRLVRRGRLDEALAAYRWALNNCKKVARAATLQAACRGLVADTLNDLGRHEEAIVEFRQALEVLKDIPGTTLEQIQYREKLSTSLRGLGRHEEAIREVQALLSASQGLPGTEQGLP